jgi:ABC-type Mn2+/Zn2+ transport system permease subunit
MLSIAFALVASEGGLLASLRLGTLKPSVSITFFSFGIYLVARLVGPAMRQRR